MHSVFGLVLLVLTQSGPAPVPVEQDPRHREVFANEHVRVFDIAVQPGEATSMHTHVFDNIGVRLSDARLGVELYDGSKSVDVVTRGAVGFTDIAGPVTHKVSNIGDTPFLNIVVELLQPAEDAASPPPATPAEGASIVDNERVRISRTILLEGESTPRRTYEFRGIRVVVRGEGTASGEPGGARSGNVHWHDSGVAYALENHSPEPFEVVEIELK